mgnify:CR=1 FL=1
MPKIFLSPSTQDYNSYVNGGNEALYANLIADAMEPYLRASGIDFTRNDPNGNVSTSIAAWRGRGDLSDGIRAEQEAGGSH